MDLKIVLGILFLFVGAAIGIAFYLMNRKSSGQNQQETRITWTASEPGICSRPCGGGKAYRNIDCVSMQGDQIVSYLSDNYCDPALKPSNSVDCNTQPCSWITGDWTACSQSCGGGTRTRDVTCGGPDGTCTGDKPSTSEACNTQSCDWVVGDWSLCTDSTGKSVSCGRDASKKRTVTCPIPDKCTGAKPDEIQECTDLPYCDWNATAWTPDCSTYVCGKGKQTRTVSCFRNQQNTDFKNCDPSKTPNSDQICDTGLVCAWHTYDKWYPYPVPTSVTFSGSGSIQPKLLASTNQYYGIDIAGNNFVEKPNPSNPIVFNHTLVQWVPFIVATNAGFSSNSDGSFLQPGNFPYMLGFTFDGSIKDIITAMVSGDNFIPVILEKDAQGRITARNGKAPTNYYPA